MIGHILFSKITKTDFDMLPLMFDFTAGVHIYRTYICICSIYQHNNIIIIYLLCIFENNT